MARALFVASVTVTVFTLQMCVTQLVMSPGTRESLLGNSPNKTACGDNLCTCSGDLADCSDHAVLHYIPRLPGAIRYLNFSYNHLGGIYHGSFFQNVTNLYKLYLNNNGIKYINPEAFGNFTQLQWLNMEYNNLNLLSLSAFLKVSTLTTLTLVHCDLRRFPDWVFNNATLPKLRRLFLYGNHIEHIRLSTFRPLAGLKRLDLSNNKISHLSVDHVSDIKYLNLNVNDLSDFPTTCSETNSSLFPRLALLSLSDNRISSIGWACLPDLRKLVLSGNILLSKPQHAFHLRMFPRLTKLILKHTKLPIRTLTADAFNSRSLHMLSLEFNHLDFEKKSIDVKCFANCTRLTYLQLSYNHLNISEERFIGFFGHLAQMQTLLLENCNIRVLTPRMFSGFPRLKTLALDRNSLSRIPDGTFDGLRKLSTLKLSSNQISVVPPTLFNADTRQRLTSLDLSGNPFTCSCDVLWFQSWYLSHPSLFPHVWGSYDCSNVPGVDIGSFYLDSQACLLSRGAAVMVIVSVSLVLLVLALVVTVFRYRWHFRLLLHEAFRGNGETRRRRLETGRFQYDLFVSFDSDNLPWVLQHLVPQLEERRGLRLCLHQRDFIPGRNIVDNIAECVESSKKVLMLFSTSFVQSQWCQFELALCMRYVMDYDDALVIVCLYDVPSRDLTTAMIAVLKTTTYIQWVDDDNDAMASFWGRLDVTLQEICPRRDVIIPVE